MPRRLLPLLAAVPLLAPGLAFAADDTSEPPVFGAEVSVVSVPVFVADAGGRALRGLQPEDFELYDDKDRVPIVSFQYIDTTSPESQELVRQAPAARRRFLLLFDLSFTDLGGLHRARQAALELVRHGLAATDLAAVATFDSNRGLRLVANFTEDKSVLLRAVETLGVPSLARIRDPLSLVVAELGDVPLGPRELASDATTAAIGDAVLAVIARRMRAMDESIYRAQVLQLLASFDDLARALRGVEGRKQVVYFSAGFDSKALIGASGNDMRIASEALVWGEHYDVDPEERYGDSRLRRAFSEAVRALSNADCVVHAVDVTGLGREDSLQQTEVARDLSRDLSGATSGRESLNFVSAETGGRFFKDTHDLDLILDEVLEMTSRYYILGYQPDDLAGPGRFHRLKVKVRRKGARVSHRAGYYERVPRPSQTSLQRQFESAQLVMTGVGPNDLRFSALCLPFPAPGERQALGVVLQVPREVLQGDGATALEVYGYVVREDGTVEDHLAQIARIDPQRADPGGRAKGVSFFGTFSIPPGRYTVRLMLQNPASGSSGVQFIDVAVPPYDASAGFLLPPVVVEQAADWLNLALNGPEDVFPFVVDGRPFVPRTSFSVEEGVSETLVLVSYEPEQPRDPAAGIEIHSSLTDASGAPVAPGLLRLDRVHREAGGRRTYVLAYTPAVKEPGDYMLRVGIGEAGTRLESYALLRVGGAETGTP